MGYSRGFSQKGGCKKSTCQPPIKKQIKKTHGSKGPDISREDCTGGCKSAIRDMEARTRSPESAQELLGSQDKKLQESHVKVTKLSLPLRQEAMGQELFQGPRTNPAKIEPEES